jgi:hypothetical protein
LAISGEGRRTALSYGNFQNECKKQKLKNNLRLRLLFNPKLVILLKDSRLKHAPGGACRKRSFNGIPVPGLERE